MWCTGGIEWRGADAYTTPRPGPCMQVAYSSQFGEDVWLSQNLFYNKRGGFYVEMGAMNGVDL